jgi:hypothetical protein
MSPALSLLVGATLGLLGGAAAGYLVGSRDTEPRHTLHVLVVSEDAVDHVPEELRAAERAVH